MAARGGLAFGAVALVALALAPAARAADPRAALVDRTAGPAVAAPPATARAQQRLRRQLGPRALVAPDPATGTPRIVARLDGHLSGPSSASPAEIALGFVRAHAAAFGLDGDDLAGLALSARDTTPDGVVNLAWEQRAGGVPVVDGGLHAAVSADGRLINVRGGAVPDPPAGPPAPDVGAAHAYAVADPGGAPPPAAASRPGAERVTDFADGARASLVRYRDGADDRLGWRVLIPAGSSAFYDAIVDARTGRLQRRTNRVRLAAPIAHFDLNPRAEGGVTTTTAPPAGWYDSGAQYFEGPYVRAVSDLDDSIGLAQASAPFALTSEPDLSDRASSGVTHAPKLGGANGFCDPQCSWTGVGGLPNRAQNREFSVQQLFWYANTFRQHLASAPIGFTSASGAFEGGDRVLAQALDGANTNPSGTTPDAAHLNNASMLTLPDGYRPLLTTHLFALGGTRYDGAHDASLVYHEYAHGLSERLVTDAQGFGALTGAQPGALSEGTSDFYALDFLEASGEVNDTAPFGQIRLGNNLQLNPLQTGTAGTVRTQGLDCPVNNAGAYSACPGTASAGQGGYDYADFGRVTGAPEIHADGEIWAETLWSLRAALIINRGEAEGIRRAREYVTGGLRLAPENPTMLDMRNAIVQAAVNARGNTDWAIIWSVFAARGMGWSATTKGPNDVTPLARYDAPPAPGTGGRGAIAGAITDEAGAPVGGATVSVAGHDTGLGATDLSTTSLADGNYGLGSVPAGSYPDVYVRRPGFQEATTGVTVTAGVTSVVNFQPLRRDYASLVSGAAVAAFTGTDFSATQCGPAQLLDDDKRTVWSTYADQGAQDLIVDLGRQVDLREVRIDPRAGCGDGAEASLSRYELAVSDGPGAEFEQIAEGVLGASDPRGYVSLPLAGDAAGRRLLRLRAIEPRSLSQPTARPFMDVSELEVTGTPTPPPPARPPTGPSATPTATPTVFRGSRLRASRKGKLKVRVRFGSAAPAGRARLTVLGGGRRYARGRLTVRPGRTVTKTLRLNKLGRKKIKPGRTRRVTLELRLPGGEKIKKQVKLTRSRR